MKRNPNIWWCKTRVTVEDDTVLTDADSIGLHLYEPGGENNRVVEDIQRSFSESRFYWKHRPGKKVRPTFIGICPGFLCCQQEYHDELSQELDIPSVCVRFEVEQKAYVLFGPTVFNDILDFSRSKCRFLSTGTPAQFKEVAITKYPVGTPDLFGISGPKSIMNQTFVTDDFVNKCRSDDVTGLKFTALKY